MHAALTAALLSVSVTDQCLGDYRLLAALGFAAVSLVKTPRPVPVHRTAAPLTACRWLASYASKLLIRKCGDTPTKKLMKKADSQPVFFSPTYL